MSFAIGKGGTLVLFVADERGRDASHDIECGVKQSVSVSIIKG